MIDAMLFLSSLEDCVDPSYQTQSQSTLTHGNECLDIRMLIGQDFRVNSGQMKPPEFSNMEFHTPNLMSPTGPCGLCSLPILDKNFLLIGNMSWHEECARCSVCNEKLDGHQTCYSKNDALYCKRDYVAKFWRHCERCCEAIEPGYFVIMSKDGYYHSECFSCVICGIILRQGDTYMIGEKSALFCQAHYESYLRLNESDMLSNPTDEMFDEEPRDKSVKLRSGSKASKCAKFSPVETSNESNTLYYDSSGDGENKTTPNGNKVKRMRTSFKHHQLRTMKNYFNLNHNPDAKDLKQLAQKTGLTKRVLQVWFQNARAKWRRSQHGHQDGETSAYNNYSKCSETLKLNSSLGSGIDSQSFESISPKTPIKSDHQVYSEIN